VEYKQAIKADLGRLGPEKGAEADALIDKSWDEILSVLGRRMDDEERIGTTSIKEIERLTASLSKSGIRLEPQATNKRLRLTVEADPSLQLRHLAGDPTRLGQVLTNLAGNAIKFTDTGAVTVRVRMVAETANDLLVRFEVQDTGIGMGADDQKRLFLPFELIWAGGRAGRVAAQVGYWWRRNRDEIKARKARGRVGGARQAAPAPARKRPARASPPNPTPADAMELPAVALPADPQLDPLPAEQPTAAQRLARSAMNAVRPNR
jgi:hypothetical protein